MRRGRCPKLTLSEIQTLESALDIFRSDNPDTEPDEPEFSQNHVDVHKECDKVETKLYKIKQWLAGEV